MSASLHNTLKKLEAYNNSSSPIISLYLYNPTLKKFQNILSQIFKNQQLELQKNIEYIEGLLQTYLPHYVNETVVIFSGGNNLFEVLHIPYKMEDIIIVNHSPFVYPILKNNADFARFLAIFIDREKAIYLSIFNNRIEEKYELKDKNIPQNVHANASEALYAQREDKINRHIQMHLDKHFEHVAIYAEHIIKKIGPVNGIIIGGHKNLMHKFMQKLSPNLKQKIIGESVSELHVNLNELLEKAIKIIKKTQKNFENQTQLYFSI